MDSTERDSERRLTSVIQRLDTLRQHTPLFMEALGSSTSKEQMETTESKLSKHNRKRGLDIFLTNSERIGRCVFDERIGSRDKWGIVSDFSNEKYVTAFSEACHYEASSDTVSTNPKEHYDMSYESLFEKDIFEGNNEIPNSSKLEHLNMFGNFGFSQTSSASMDTQTENNDHMSGSMINIQMARESSVTLDDACDIETSKTKILKYEPGADLNDPNSSDHLIESRNSSKKCYSLHVSFKFKPTLPHSEKNTMLLKKRARLQRRQAILLKRERNLA